MERDISLFLAVEKIVQDKLFFHQGKLVVKDVDIAGVYEVKIKELRAKIRNNRSRFPLDFMAEIRDGEYAFTEPGILMLGGLLKSERAVKVHLQFIEYFVHLAHENGTSIFDLIKTDRNIRSH
jgi:hypothetical protein